jgi:hypothetical protein
MANLLTSATPTRVINHGDRRRPADRGCVRARCSGWRGTAKMTTLFLAGWGWQQRAAREITRRSSMVPCPLPPMAVDTVIQ